jgi:hypothetical protein
VQILKKKSTLKSLKGDEVHLDELVADSTASVNEQAKLKALQEAEFIQLIKKFGLS